VDCFWISLKIIHTQPFHSVVKTLSIYFPDSTWNEFHQVYFKEIFSKLGKPLLLEYLANSIKSTEDLPENIEHKRKWQGEEDEAYIAEVPELPGCMADGKTYEEALKNAEVIIEEWLKTAEELGRPIPEPKKGKLMFA
jgi:predicted RNase H-like HicB family nuclease